MRTFEGIGRYTRRGGISICTFLGGISGCQRLGPGGARRRNQEEPEGPMKKQEASGELGDFKRVLSYFKVAFGLLYGEGVTLGLLYSYLVLLEGYFGVTSGLLYGYVRSALGLLWRYFRISLVLLTGYFRVT